MSEQKLVQNLFKWDIRFIITTYRIALFIYLKYGCKMATIFESADGDQYNNSEEGLEVKRQMMTLRLIHSSRSINELKKKEGNRECAISA